MRNAIASMVVLAGAAGALAQVSPTGPFTGARQDGFTTQWDPNRCVFCNYFDIFQANAKIVDHNGASNMHVTGSWGFACGIGQHNTPWIFGSAGGPAAYTFNPGEEPGKFGGYWGSNAPTQNGMVEFYDLNNTLVGTDIINTEPCGTWHWYGWEFTVRISKIVTRSNYGPGGWLMNDDMEWDAFGGAPCYPDCDTSTGPGMLDIFDFLCFQNRYAAGSPYACDCDTSTGRGVCDIFDFTCFQNAYANGCP